MDRPRKKLMNTTCGVFKAYAVSFQVSFVTPEENETELNLLISENTKATVDNPTNDECKVASNREADILVTNHRHSLIYENSSDEETSDVTHIKICPVEMTGFSFTKNARLAPAEYAKPAEVELDQVIVLPTGLPLPVCSPCIVRKVREVAHCNESAHKNQSESDLAITTSYNDDYEWDSSDAELDGYAQRTRDYFMVWQYDYT